MRNNLCKSYSDCYSALPAWRATVANLKKKMEMPRLLDFILGVNSGFFLQNLEMPSPVGDALRFRSEFFSNQKLICIFFRYRSDFFNICRF